MDDEEDQDIQLIKEGPNATQAKSLSYMSQNIDIDAGDGLGLGSRIW